MVRVLCSTEPLHVANGLPASDSSARDGINTNSQLRPELRKFGLLVQAHQMRIALDTAPYYYADTPAVSPLPAIDNNYYLRAAQYHVNESASCVVQALLHYFNILADKCCIINLAQPASYGAGSVWRRPEYVPISSTRRYQQTVRMRGNTYTDSET